MDENNIDLHLQKIQKIKEILENIDCFRIEISSLCKDVGVHAEHGDWWNLMEVSKELRAHLNLCRINLSKLRGE